MAAQELAAAQFASTVDSQSAREAFADTDVPIKIGGPALAFMGTLSDAANRRNTTVLPAIEVTAAAVQLKPRAQTRYQRIRKLATGAMGEVSLGVDNDIGRTIAVKKLITPTQNPAGIARFIEEIRTIGQLEHPNIVPIHDVGIDEQGQIFFVMKHVDGETLESIIAKLEAGDRPYMERYTIEVRLELFMGLLRALQCAHARGIVHRDLKPANIMVGRYGEVVLMDWGVAKILPTSEQSVQSQFTTQPGEIIGTPAYMSPEQASGDVQKLDQRSDIYSATVLFHELLAVQHYLAPCKSIAQVMRDIQSESFGYLRLAFIHHPQHPVPPAELLHFIVKGLAKDPDARYQNVEEMIAELERIRDGRCRVSCPATLAKRMTSTVGRFVNRYPKLSPFIFYSGIISLITYVALTARLLLAHGL